MIKELVKFSQSLDDQFKKRAIQPKEGLHILLGYSNKDGKMEINPVPRHFEIFSKKMDEESDFIESCKLKANNAWCVNTNKCFDLPTKAIHSCSPFLVAFKREHLKEGGKYGENAKKGKTQIYDRFDAYFNKAMVLVDQDQKEKYRPFEEFLSSRKFEYTLNLIDESFLKRREEIEEKIQNFKDGLNTSLSKNEVRDEIKSLEKEQIKYKALDESDYILFYLDVPLELYAEAHLTYLQDKLFNTDKYNVEDKESGLIFGTSDFMNGYNSNMPFLTHQTSTFDITGRISNTEAKALYEFEGVLKGKVLPNPLPLFIYEEELLHETIGIFREDGNRASFKEIIEKLFQWNRAKDIGNYYLLNWANTKDGLVFNDLDYVSKFEYNMEMQIDDLFNSGRPIHVSNIFVFQETILPIIFNNDLVVKTKAGGKILKFFDDLDEKYIKSSLNLQLILKYRKAFYDYIYKSRRSAINSDTFHDIMKTSILEDIRLDKMENGFHTERSNILNKLNIWISLYEFFDINKPEKIMANQLLHYQEVVSGLINGSLKVENLSDAEFMFASGQIVEYLHSKSKSADNSYNLLEPYLQKSSVEGLLKVIANDFARYKHENYSGNFEKVASAILAHESNINPKDFLPQFLSGVFSKNQLFSNKITETQN